MKNNLTLSITILLLLFTVCSSAQINKFERVYGGAGYDYGNSITRTFDKGYILAGSTSSFGMGSSDAYLLKIDSLGIPLWQKNFGDINIDHFYSVKETMDSGFVAAGYTNSSGNGGYDMFIVKTDKNGETSWVKSIGGTDWDLAYSITETADSGYVVAGGTFSYGLGSEDIYLVKLNALGDTLWTRTYGGAMDEEARSIQQTSDNGFILTGFSKSFGNINGDVYTIKTNSTGDTLWTKTLGYSGIDIGNNIKQTSSGDYILAGTTQLSAGYNQAFIVKMNPAGDTIFTRKYGVPNDAAAFDICEAADGGYTWTGKLKIGTRYNVYFFKIDVNGWWNFAFTFGGINGDDEGRSIELTSDNGFIVAGNSNSFNNGLGDAYVYKTDSAGASSGVIINNATAISNFTTDLNNEISLFPNPSDSKVMLKLNSQHRNQEIILIIYDQLGRILEEKKMHLNQDLVYQFDVSGLANGMYFIKVCSEEQSFSSKFIVEHN
jgi:hypothetical protein